jgi:hypothetical protein
MVNDIIEERQRIEDQLRKEDPARFLTRDGKRGYVCPVCKSGSHGKHNTGIRKREGKNGPRYTCYRERCIDGGDIFELIGLKFHIKDFAGQVEKAAAIYGYDLPKAESYNKTER